MVPVRPQAQLPVLEVVPEVEVEVEVVVVQVPPPPLLPQQQLQGTLI